MGSNLIIHVRKITASILHLHSKVLSQLLVFFNFYCAGDNVVSEPDQSGSETNMDDILMELN